MSEDFRTELLAVTTGIVDMLVEKNRKYGNSALSPIRVFSRADTLEQLRVRMDDKLSRLRTLPPDEDEDVIQDLLGYLVLYEVARKRVAEGRG